MGLKTRSVLIKAEMTETQRYLMGLSDAALVEIRGSGKWERCQMNIPFERVIEVADTIPVEWIRQQAEEFPGMESAMWGKLIRLWKKKIDCEELYGGDNENG